MICTLKLDICGGTKTNNNSMFLACDVYVDGGGTLN